MCYGGPIRSIQIFFGLTRGWVLFLLGCIFIRQIGQSWSGIPREHQARNAGGLENFDGTRGPVATAIADGSTHLSQEGVSEEHPCYHAFNDQTAKRQLGGTIWDIANPGNAYSQAHVVKLRFETLRLRIHPMLFFWGCLKKLGLQNKFYFIFPS